MLLALGAVDAEEAKELAALHTHKTTGTHLDSRYSYSRRNGLPHNRGGLSLSRGYLALDETPRCWCLLRWSESQSITIRFQLTAY
jgi:hypothetical protein